MPRKSEYTPQHAASGARAPLPAIETWPNQYRGYEITISIPEYTSICPRTGLPGVSNNLDIQSISPTAPLRKAGWT